MSTSRGKLSCAIQPNLHTLNLNFGSNQVWKQPNFGPFYFLNQCSRWPFRTFPSAYLPGWGHAALKRPFREILIRLCADVCWQRFSRTRARREIERFRPLSTAKSISVTIQTDKRLILDTVLMQLRSVSLGVVRNVFHLLFLTGGKLQIVTSPRLFLLSFPGPRTPRNPWAKNIPDTQTLLPLRRSRPLEDNTWMQTQPLDRSGRSVSSAWSLEITK